jgi:tRNA(Arg) A34 adenosine deaminase TadA
MGCLGGAFSLNSLPQINHRVEIITDVMRAECHAIIQQFFKAKR